MMMGLFYGFELVAIAPYKYRAEHGIAFSNVPVGGVVHIYTITGDPSTAFSISVMAC